MSDPAPASRKTRAAFLAKLAGRGLMLLAIVFLIRQGARHWADLSTWRPEAWQIGVILAIAICYGASIFVVAEVWHRIVNIFAPEARKRTYPSYTMTQIAKYIPGNVAHLLGRAIYLKGGALSNRQLGIATLLEIAVMPAAAGSFVLLAALAIPVATLLPQAAFLQPFVLPATIGLGLVLLGALAIPRSVRLQVPARTLAGTTLLALIFMCLLGLAFATLLNTISPAPPLLAALVAVLGWIVGYFTPGAPGGLGTREALMLLLLDGTVPQSEALIAISLFRLVTVLGDTVCFGAGWVLYRTIFRPEEPEGVASAP
ncbi:hypothetical protein LX81_02832 [Palleronia aestuarii]|uniref:Lysylphosphatidylglycerol synthase-like protein n=1 Tax=Palleronia aestuarii TaxID=568105 RepID=A0A2W7N318_9RHOB|nr:lysylphosphatidylglycerol synthase domain-containing protein [Palleronia aestuarii]PZX14458.1 hypothetical protein LX81_02832 [Palleronia aestuarii]